MAISLLFTENQVLTKLCIFDNLDGMKNVLIGKNNLNGQEQGLMWKNKYQIISEDRFGGS